MKHFPRIITPSEADVIRQEQLHSLLDGRAHYKADQSSEKYHREIARNQHSSDSPRAKVTLANAFFPSYLA